MGAGLRIGVIFLPRAAPLTDRGGTIRSAVEVAARVRGEDLAMLAARTCLSGASRPMGAQECGHVGVWWLFASGVGTNLSIESCRV